MLQRANNTECVFVFSVMSNVLQRANNVQCVFVFSVMSNMLRKVNNAKDIFVFSVMSNVLQRVNKAEHGLLSGMFTRTSTKLLYWFASHCVCIFSDVEGMLQHANNTESWHRACSQRTSTKLSYTAYCQ